MSVWSACHSHDITLSSTIGALIGIRRARAEDDLDHEIELKKDRVRTSSEGKASPQGEYLLAAVDRYLVRILAHYLVRGSVLWWVLVPLQWTTWIFRDRKIPVAAEVSQAIEQPLPGGIARKVLDDTPGNDGDFADSYWNGHHVAFWHRDHAQVA